MLRKHVLTPLVRAAIGEEIAGDQAPPQQGLGTEAQLASRVLNDVFHLMLNLAPMKAHPSSKDYQRELRDAFFVFDEQERRDITVILEKKNATFEEELEIRPEWILRRARRRVPPPTELYSRVKTVLDKFSALPNTPTGIPLLTAGAKKSAPEVLELIRRGFVSDPPDIELYVEQGRDADGLPLYRCLRGTNAVEGLHSKLIKRFTAFNADPELVDCYLALFRHQHNVEVRRQPRIHLDQSFSADAISYPGWPP